MNETPFRISRRSLAIAASLVGMVSLAIGAHAALNNRALEPAKTAASEQNAGENVVGQNAISAGAASRGNPYERRFRAFSHGLAPITAPDNALILSSATPGLVADDSNGHHSVLVAELLNHVAEQGAGAETVFNKTRIAVAKATDGEQV